MKTESVNTTAINIVDGLNYTYIYQSLAIKSVSIQKWFCYVEGGKVYNGFQIFFTTVSFQKKSKSNEPTYVNKLDSSFELFSLDVFCSKVENLKMESIAIDSAFLRIVWRYENMTDFEGFLIENDKCKDGPLILQCTKDSGTLNK